MTKADVTAIDPRLVKAMAHPLRMRLLTLLNQRVASPSELAKELGEPLGNVSYHVRILAELGCLELVRTTPRRGAVEHHYRALTRPWFKARDWARLPKPARRAISDAVLAQVWDDTAAAVEAGTFDSRANRRLLRTTLVLDDEGWDDVAALLDETLDRVLEIQAEAAARLGSADAPEPSGSSRLVLIHHEAAQPQGSKRRRANTAKRGTRV